jgi:hypothetical protein
MSKRELLQEVENRARRYEQEYRGFGQCTLLAIQEGFGLTGGDVLKAATGVLQVE